MTVKPKPGRPRNDAVARQGDKKQAIAVAASQAFNSRGFDKTTIRHIAETAGVDPKLVVHYFGTKAELFASTFSLPEQSVEITDVFTTIPRADWGTVIAGLLINETHQLAELAGAGLIRAATTHPSGASIFRDIVLQNSLGPFLTSIGLDNATMRAATLESLLFGISFSDHILEIPLEPEAEYRRRKALLATLIHAILTSDLG